MMRYWQTSIYRKMIAAFLIAIIIPAILAIIYTLTIVRGKELNLAEMQSHREANNQSTQILSIFDDVGSSLDIIGALPIIARYLDNQDLTTKQEIQQIFQVIADKKPIYDQIRILSPEGLELVRVNNGGSIVSDDLLQDKSGLDYFVNTIALVPDEIYISPIEPNQEYGTIEQPIKPVIRFAKPLWVDNQVKGILIFNVLVDELFASVNNGDAFAKTYLVSETGEFVYTYGGDPSLLYANQLGHEHTFQSEYPDIVFDKLTGATTALDYSHNHYLTYIPLVLNQQNNTYKWLLLTEYALDDVLRVVNQTITNILILEGFVILIALLTFAIFVRQITNPIYLLKQAIDEISKNDWHKSKKLIRMMNTQDEIGKLASAFNDMVHNLQLMYDTLEERVEERTKELALANEQLMHQERIKTQFLEDMAHEIRTPLTSLSLNTELVERNPSKAKKYYKNIQIHVNRIRILTENIMQIARLDFSNMVRQMDSVDVQNLIEPVVEMHAAFAKDQNLKLSLQIPDKLPAIKGNYNQLSQVIDNLVVNAIKYSEEGQIDIIASHDVSQNRVCITVKDRGIGIAKADLAYIFDRYYRTQNVRQTSVAGTGLGLSIVKEIVDLHHGEIKVASVLGEGTTISVYFPVAKEITEEMAYNVSKK